MKRLLLPPLIVLLLGIPLSLAILTVRAEPSEPFSLTWDAIVSGGGDSSGGPYTLADTAGQPAVGASSGGPYSLSDGFQASGGGSVPPLTPRLYLPAILT